MPDVKGNAEHIYYALQAGSSNDILKSLYINVQYNFLEEMS